MPTPGCPLLDWDESAAGDISDSDNYKMAGGALWRMLSAPLKTLLKYPTTNNPPYILPPPEQQTQLYTFQKTHTKQNKLQTNIIKQRKQNTKLKQQIQKLKHKPTPNKKHQSSSSSSKDNDRDIEYNSKDGDDEVTLLSD